MHQESVTRMRRALRAGACAALLAWTAGCHFGDLFGSGAASRAESGTGEHLAFTGEPGNVRVNEAIAPAVEVTVIDSLGAVSTRFSGTVTLVLVASQGAGTLGGRTTSDVENGVATFPDLSLDQPGTRYRLTASSAGLESVTSAPFDVIGDVGGREPAALEAVSGDDQRDTVAAALDDPYVVRVTDVDGQPVPGVTVSWSVTDGGGTITPASSLTGNDGQTTARHTLGTTVGAHAATATVEGLDGSPVTFDATATHAAPAQLAFTTQPTNAGVDEAISPPVQVTVRDQFGNDATTWTGAATVSLAANPGNATLSGTTTRTADAGVVTFSGLSLDAPGNGYRLRVSAGDFPDATSGAFNVTDDGGGGGGEPETLTRVSGDGQTGTVGEPLGGDYVVRVTDANGDPVAGVMVSWTVTAGGGSVSPASSSTNGDGRAAARHTLGTGTGTHSVRASVSEVSPVTFSSTAVAGAADELAFTVQPSDADVNEPITPAVEVTAFDQFGNRATSFTGSVTLAISANPGGGSLDGTTSRAASAGVATFPGLNINEPGDGYRLSAAASGVTGATSAAFDIADGGGGGGGEPETLTRVSGNGQTGTVGEPLDADYVVRVTDANGDPVAGVTVSWTVTAGGGSVSPTSSTTGGDGRADARHTLGTGTGTHSVRASVSGLSPVTFSSTARAGAPDELVFTTQPSDAGIGEIISPPVRVTVRDAFGNTVTQFSGSISMSITPLSGTLGATLNGTRTRSVVNGVATFDDLSIDLVGVAYRLRATGAGLSEDSAAFEILL